MYEKIKKWYEQGLWTVSMIMDALSKGVLTQEQVNEILGKED